MAISRSARSLTALTVTRRVLKSAIMSVATRAHGALMDT